jgi:hypothetical protein
MWLDGFDGHAEVEVVLEDGVVVAAGTLLRL